MFIITDLIEKHYLYLFVEKLSLLESYTELEWLCTVLHIIFTASEFNMNLEEHIFITFQGGIMRFLIFAYGL